MEAKILNALTWALVSRTVVIDDAVRAKANPQLVILGAGLDARAYRLPELAEVDVYEVDHPASQQDKRDRIKGLRPVAKSLTHVSVDFGRDPLSPALAKAGHDTTTPTTWIWEAVTQYLTETDVHATVRVIDECSAPGSRLIVTYSPPNPLTAIVNPWNRVVLRLIGVRHPFENEPRLSSWRPEAMHTLMTAHHFAVTDEQDLHSVARQLGISVSLRGRSRPTTRWPPRSLRGGVAIADKLATG